MAYEVNFAQAEFVDDVQNVLRIAAQSAVPGFVESGRIGRPRPYVVEEYDFEVGGEGRSNVTPHALVTTVAMTKHQRAITIAPDFHVVAKGRRHHFAFKYG